MAKLQPPTQCVLRQVTKNETSIGNGKEFGCASVPQPTRLDLFRTTLAVTKCCASVLRVSRVWGVVGHVKRRAVWLELDSKRVLHLTYMEEICFDGLSEAWIGEHLLPRAFFLVRKVVRWPNSMGKDAWCSFRPSSNCKRKSVDSGYLDCSKNLLDARA